VKNVIIGVDPSLNSSGIVVLDEKGGPINYEAIHPLPLDGPERLFHNYQRYITLFTTYKIRCVAFEKQVSQMRFQYDAKNILDLAENIGVFKMALSTAAHLNPGLLVLAFTPNEIKKFATGNHKADKTDMMAQVPVRHMNAMKKEIQEHSINDVADAYFAARYAHKILTLNEDITPFLFKQY
jgi:Holliday junction resolvasome RuvABC endonuclease subunit